MPVLIPGMHCGLHEFSLHIYFLAKTNNTHLGPCKDKDVTYILNLLIVTTKPFYCELMVMLKSPQFIIFLKWAVNLHDLMWHLSNRVQLNSSATFSLACTTMMFYYVRLSIMDKTWKIVAFLWWFCSYKSSHTVT